jgi:hypothetical protein
MITPKAITSNHGNLFTWSATTVPLLGLSPIGCTQKEDALLTSALAPSHGEEGIISK